MTSDLKPGDLALTVDFHGDQAHLNGQVVTVLAGPNTCTCGIPTFGVRFPRPQWWFGPLGFDEADVHRINLIKIAGDDIDVATRAHIERPIAADHEVLTGAGSV